MPIVTVHEVVELPPEEVWLRVCDVESYPTFMESVQRTTQLSCTNLPDGRVEGVTEWEVLLKGSVLKWTERELRDPVTRRIDYEQVSGDLARFEGYWQISESARGTTKATLQVDFEIGIPMLRPMLDPVAVRAIEGNCVDMLRAFGRRAA